MRFSFRAGAADGGLAAGAKAVEQVHRLVGEVGERGRVVLGNEGHDLI